MLNDFSCRIITQHIQRLVVKASLFEDLNKTVASENLQTKGAAMETGQMMLTQPMTMMMMMWLMMMMMPRVPARPEANLAQMDNSGGGCVYTFHAWVPSQDILKRLRDLEYKCSNSTQEWERYLGNTRAQVLEELLSHKNLTNHVERQLLEQEMEDVQLKIAIKDVRLELVDIRGEQSELRALIDESDLSVGQHRLRHKVSNSDFQSVKSEMQGLHHSVGQLKNNVGDLKAEWLLIKREVTNIQTDNQELHREQDAIREETGKTKRIVDEVQTDTIMLKRQHEEMRSVNEKMSRGLSELRNREIPGGQHLPDGNEAHERLDRQVADLKNQNIVLQSQIERIHDDNKQLKKEVLAVAMSSRNGSNDLGVWLRKLPDAQPMGFTAGRKDHKEHPWDCHEVYQRGFHTSGVYQIKPRGANQLDNVYCEMINNTGWTLLQRRVDGTLAFDRGWMEYKFGFGNFYGEFWLGNEWIHQLTSQKQCKMRIDLWDWEGGRSHAEYSYFKVASEKDKYTIHVRDYDGTAGDSLSNHDGMAFSTVDSDNDFHMTNCAEDNKAGWWFRACYTANLNGVYHPGWYAHGQKKYADGITWFTLKESEFYSLKRVEIKIRPTYL